MLNLLALVGLGISVGIQWGVAPAFAAVCFTWCVMPYQIVGHR